MTFLALMELLSPLALLLGFLAIFLLAAAGVIALLRILIKPTLIIFGCATVCYLVYNYLTMLSA